jgi:type I restriction enzyme S subunit
MGSEWNQFNLKDIIEYVADNRGKNPKSYSECGIPVIDNYLITSDWRIDLTKSKRTIDPETYRTFIRKHIKEDDVLITLVGNGFGQVAITPKEKCVIIQNTIGLRCNSENNNHFLYYLLKGNRESLINLNIGAAQPSIKVGNLLELSFKLPPLPEQKAIAHILGRLDDKIELNRKMNATLEGMAQALFKSWFVDFDPVIDNALAAGNPIPDELADRAEVRRQALADGAANREAAKAFPANFQQTESMGWIPEGWEVGCFGDVSKCFDSKRIPLSKPQRDAKKPGKIPYYGATSIMDYVNEWIFDDTYLLIGEDGSVIKEDGTPFVQYIWGKSWVNNHAHVLQGKDGISTEHLMLFMQSQNLAAYVTGAVQLKINQKNMNSIPFLKAGGSVNLRFTKAVTDLYDRIKLLSEENETLTNLRDTLLPKLISGELRCTEAKQLIEKALG